MRLDGRRHRRGDQHHAAGGLLRAQAGEREKHGKQSAGVAGVGALLLSVLGLLRFTGVYSMNIELTYINSDIKSFLSVQTPVYPSNPSTA